MSTMDQFVNMASQAASNAGRAARLMAYITGHKLQIICQQERIRQLYTRLGKLCYKDRITDEEPDEAEYKPVCDAISDAYRRISHLRDELENAKDAYRAERDGIAATAETEDEPEMDFIPLTDVAE